MTPRVYLKRIVSALVAQSTTYRVFDTEPDLYDQGGVPHHPDGRIKKYVVVRSPTDRILTERATDEVSGTHWSVQVVTAAWHPDEVAATLSHVRAALDGLRLTPTSQGLHETVHLAGLDTDLTPPTPYVITEWAADLTGADT